jgi:hypothetical protein
MIRPLDEYSPEDRAFVEYVEQLRRQSPRSCLILHDAGPINVAEIKAILAEPDEAE